MLARTRLAARACLLAVLFGLNGGRDGFFCFTSVFVDDDAGGDVQ